MTTRRFAPVAALVFAFLADGTLAVAQPQFREPPPPGRRIGARDGDLIVVDHDARVGFVRRRPASVRVIYNGAERWVILLADFSTPNGEPDGNVDHSYNWRQVEGTWPLGERWEGSAILEEFSAPGSGPNSWALVVPQGRIQFLSTAPMQAMFDDAQAIAQLRYRSGGSGMVGRLNFDRAEQEARRIMARNAGNSSFSTFDVGGVQGGVTVGSSIVATSSSPYSAPAGPMDPNAPVRVGGSVVMPRKTHDVAPIYPEAMRQSGVSGIVILEITIERDGSIRSAKLLRGIVPAIDQAALDAAKQWKYEPVLLNGAPVPVIFTATVSVRP